MLSVAALMSGVDNLLDILFVPVAVVAGTLVKAAVITDLPPMVKWTTAVIAAAASPDSRKAYRIAPGEIHYRQPRPSSAFGGSLLSRF
jgi:hypothetical protein